jgi:hypothetical protein
MRLSLRHFTASECGCWIYANESKQLCVYILMHDRVRNCCLSSNKRYNAAFLSRARFVAVTMRSRLQFYLRLADLVKGI